MSFKALSGRYTPFIGYKLESLCYYKHIPDEALGELDQGSMILMGDYNSVISWLIMYLTDSTFSHIMVYDRNGFVAHQTIDGYKYQKIDELFGRRKRFLPVQFPDGPRKLYDAEEISEKLRAISQPGYDFIGVTAAGLSYLLCLNPIGFHMRQFYDLMYVLLVVALMFAILSAALKPMIFVGAVGVLLLFYRAVCRSIYGPSFYGKTPESIWRLCVYSNWRPKFNLLGFRDHMMSLVPLFKGEWGNERRYIEFPEGLHRTFETLSEEVSVARIERSEIRVGGARCSPPFRFAQCGLQSDAFARYGTGSLQGEITACSAPSSPPPPYRRPLSSPLPLHPFTPSKENT
jgi:hypothetical protein